MKHKRSTGPIWVNVTIGLELGITISLFVFVGYYLDGRYGRSPLFLSIGAVLGMIVGFYNFMRQLAAMKKKEERDAEKDKTKVRWM